MKYKLTVTPEAAAVLQAMYGNGELKGIGVTNVTEVKQPSDNSWKIDSEGSATPAWIDTIKRQFRAGKTYRAKVRDIVLHMVYVSVKSRKSVIQGFIDVPDALISTLRTYFKVGKTIRVKVIDYSWDYPLAPQLKLELASDPPDSHATM
jgi:polyribonucleotide nucleotidyltransferase